MSDLAELAKHYRRMADTAPTLTEDHAAVDADHKLWRQLADELDAHLAGQDQTPDQPTLPL